MEFLLGLLFSTINTHRSFHCVFYSIASKYFANFPPKIGLSQWTLIHDWKLAKAKNISILDGIEAIDGKQFSKSVFLLP